MKIAVFGASGQTGLLVVKQALNLGYQVTAFVRNPEKFPVLDIKLTVIKADVMDSFSFNTKLTGNDAVISTLGTGRRYDETNIYSEGGKNIIEAMRGVGVKRFICLTSAGVVDDDLSSENNLENVNKAIPNNVQRDMKKLEDYLKTINDIDWTVIRPPGLLNTEFTGNYMVMDKHIPNIGRRISRADLAHFMLTQITDNTFLDRTSTLSY